MSTGSMNALEHGPSCDDADVTLWCDECREHLRDDEADTWNDYDDDMDWP